VSAPILASLIESIQRCNVITLIIGAMITSGGGFSQVSPVPAYQRSAVNSYLASSSAMLPPANLFNASNRAYPDLSTTGHNYLVQVGSQGFIQVDRYVV